MVEALACEDRLFDAAPFWIGLLGSEHRELSQPVSEHGSEKDGRHELIKGKREERRSKNVPHIERVVEQKEEKAEGERATLFKGQLFLHLRRKAAQYLGRVEAKDEQTRHGEGRTEEYLIRREVGVDISDVEIE